jgi:hypothetical protein
MSTINPSRRLILVHRQWLGVTLGFLFGAIVSRIAVAQCIVYGEYLHWTDPGMAETMQGCEWPAARTS